MKNFIYILFILFVSSCGLLNKTNNSSKIVTKVINIDTVYVDDSTKVGQVDIEEVMDYSVKGKSKNKNESILIRRKVILYKRQTFPDFEKDSVVLLKSEEIKDSDGDGVVDNGIDRKPSSEGPIIEDDRIEDKTTKKQLDNPGLGVVAYSVPKEMQVGKTYTVKLRISKEKNKVQIVRGDGIPIADIKVDSRIIISSIRVEPVMSAKLITDSSKMIIQPVSTEIQDIEDQGFTEWAWRLTPIKGGDVLLRIVVNIKQKVDGDVILKDIPVYDEVVSIKSNVVFSISGFISQYWQWIMTTIIIPLVVWFYNKEKKKSKGK